MDIVGSKRCIELDSRLARDLVDPLDWLLADSQRARGEREREREHLARLQQKKRMRHKQNMFSGYSRGGSVAAGHICSVLDLAPTPPPSSLPPPSHPQSMPPTGLLFDLPFACFANATYDQNSHSQIQTQYPVALPVGVPIPISCSHAEIRPFELKSLRCSSSSSSNRQINLWLISYRGANFSSCIP